MTRWRHSRFGVVLLLADAGAYVLGWTLGTVAARVHARMRR